MNLLNLYGVHGETVPHSDVAPYRVYLIIAADEAMARKYAPANFKITRVEIRKPNLPNPDGQPIRCGWIGGDFPLISDD